MSKYYYKKAKRKNHKKFFRFFSFLFILGGAIIVLYVFFPLISWQVFFAKDTLQIKSPIPKSTIISVVSAGSSVLKPIDSTNAKNWFPSYKPEEGKKKVPSYTLSIPKLGIENAVVSTENYELAKNLVNYGGKAIPPETGNTVIYGHSTLPYLFNTKDYKTIFATLYKLGINDTFTVNVEGIIYSYRIHSITVVEPEDTSIFSQDKDTSHITLVTCTPPGTTWKRLIVKAKLESI